MVDRQLITNLISRQFRINELTIVLRELKLSRTGRKQELIDRILNYISQYGIETVAGIDIVQQWLTRNSLQHEEMLRVRERRELIIQEQQRVAEQRAAAFQRRREQMLQVQSNYHRMATYDEEEDEFTNSAVFSSPSRPLIRDFFDERHNHVQKTSNSLSIIDSEFPIIKFHGIECSTLDIHWMISPFYEQLRTIKSTIVDGGAKEISMQFKITSGEMIDILDNKSSILFTETHLFAAFLSSREVNNVHPMCLTEYPANFICKINDTIINYKGKGIKDLPGSSPPIDIGQYCLQGTNTLSFHFNGFSKLAASILFVKVVPIQSIMDAIKTRQLPANAKKTIINKLINKHQDDDISFGDFIVQLIDPISLTLISLPILNINCKHLQPIDCYNFLMAQKSTPLFKCPICQYDMGKVTFQIREFNVPPSLQNELQSFPITKYFRMDPSRTLYTDTFMINVLRACNDFIGPAAFYKESNLQLLNIKILPNGTWLVNDTCTNSSSDESSIELSSNEHNVPDQENHVIQDDEIVLVNATSNSIRRETYREENDVICLY